MEKLRLLTGKLNPDVLAIKIRNGVAKFLEKELEKFGTTHAQKLKEVIAEVIKDYVKEENERVKQEWAEEEEKRLEEESYIGADLGC